MLKAKVEGGCGRKVKRSSLESDSPPGQGFMEVGFEPA